MSILGFDEAERVESLTGLKSRRLQSARVWKFENRTVVAAAG